MITDTDLEMPRGTCQGYPHVGCDKDATNSILGWDLCDECAKVFIGPDPAPLSDAVLVRYTALMEGLSFDPSLEVMDEFPPERLKAEVYGIRGSEERLTDALTEARAQIEEARALILQAVEIMTPEQVGQWAGVRTWLEEAVQ
jgi:hypothetical protein